MTATRSVPGVTAITGLEPECQSTSKIDPLQICAPISPDSRSKLHAGAKSDACSFLAAAMGQQSVMHRYPKEREQVEERDEGSKVHAEQC